MDVASFLFGRFAFLGLPKGRDPHSQQDGQVLSYVNDQIRPRYHPNEAANDVSIQFPGTEPIPIQAPYGSGARDYSDRFIVTENVDIVIDVSAGNTTLR